MKFYRQSDDKYVFPYLAWAAEDVSEHPAMIVQLHGAGERGCGGEQLDKILIHGFPKVVNDENFHDCILVMPQCPEGSFWAARVESVRRFIDEMVRLYHVDTGRIYLCGLSMGGFGTWYTAMAYPELFAAIAPCCGGGMAWNASVLTMPIWTFHGLEDTVVSPHQTQEMIWALKDTHPDFRYDLYEGVAHNSWEKAFSEELLSWMLARRK